MTDMTDMITSFLLVAIPTVIAITLHEAAHGYAALWMGDDTARQAGRLSLNPLRHVDRFGTILLPGFLLLSQLLTIGHVAFMFGWAKPVPVAAWRFRHPRQGMMVVAAAGPGMNFLLAWIGAVALHVAPLLSAMPEQQGFLLTFLFYFMLANIVLGVFNLLPVPPLDGGRIVVGLLPEGAARVWARLERAGLLIVLLLVFLLPSVLRQFGVAYDPVRALLGAVTEPVFRVVMTLAGRPEAGMALLGYGQDN
jgi:Zn-dependent protease